MLRVVWEDVHEDVLETERRRIGRRADNDYVLDLTDTTISGRAVELYFDSRWYVHNRGRRVIRLVDDRGIEVRLVTDERREVLGRVVLLVDGETLTHKIELVSTTASASAGPVTRQTSPTTVDADRVALSPKQRVALVAYSARAFLDPPRFDPRPASAEEASARTKDPLVMSPVGVRKAVKKVEEKFRDRAVAPMEFADLAALLEHVRRVGLITRADLALLRDDWQERRARDWQLGTSD